MTDDTKSRYLTLMAAYVLDHGFAAASLRPLAKAAGTSDRMLIYHFKSKDALMVEVLTTLADEFTAMLDGTLPKESAPSHRALLEDVLSLVRSESALTYIRVWREVTTLAAMEQQAFIETGMVVIQRFIDWLACRMPVDDENVIGSAEAMLTVIEGVHVMDALGRSDVVEHAIERLYPRA